MKSWNPPWKLFLTTTAALAAAIGTFQTHAQDVVVDTFDTTNSVTLWSATWGTTPTLSFSTNNSDRTAQPAGSGSLRVDSVFTTSTDWQQTVIIKTITNAIKASLYQSVSVDVRVVPGSVPGTSGTFGYFEPKYNAGGTSYGGVNLSSTNWTTLTFPVPAGAADITDVKIQLGDNKFVGPVSYEVDNFRFNAPRTAISRFDETTDVDLWISEWGTASELSFDAADAGGSTNLASGSLKVYKDFTGAPSGWQQMVTKIQNFDPALVMSDYKAISVDILVDPSSVPTPLGQFGFFELKYGSGGVAFGGVNLTRTNWTRYTWDVPNGTPDIVELRVQNGNGSFVGPITYYMDNLVLVNKVGGPTLAVLTSPLDDVRRDAVVLNWLLSDGATKINTNTIALSLDGSPAPAAKVTITETASGATLVFDDTANLWSSGEHTWSLSFSDGSLPPVSVTNSGKFIVNPYPTEGTFVIEAEDFNYDGGKFNPQQGVPDLDVNVMPYLGGAYEGTNATAQVDYNGDDGNDSDLYRTELDATGSNAVNMASNTGGRWGTDRGTFNVTTSYRLAWVGGGEWENYTRIFPRTNYNVWAALSRDTRDPNVVGGTLQLVAGNPTTTNQTTYPYGTINAPGTGGWGRNMLLPVKTPAGTLATVRMDGQQTVRFTHGAGGDFDFLLFVPTGSAVNVPPAITGISRNGNNVTVTWVGGGTLYSGPSLNGPWTSTNDSDGSYTESAAPGPIYYRAALTAF